MADGTKAEQGLGQTALAVIARGQKTISAMPPERRSRLATGGLMLAAMIAGLFWFLNRPDWRVLYSGLEPRDASTVAQELGAAGIPFRASSDQSGIEVPAEVLDKARMEVAAKGMPQTGRLGFELFDKPNWVGSEFDEKVNYQRALEGELEHTIESLGMVRSARVHLAIPAASPFAQEERTAKASVVLKLKRPSLEPEQVESIRRLVAGAVENLSAQNVSLVDADGRLDMTGKGDHARVGEAEQALEAKLVAMLEPLVGTGNVRAVVNAKYDEGVEERTDEIYDPTQTVALSMQKTDQVSAAAAKPSGVPGTASNTPAAAPVGAVAGSAKAAAPGVPPLLQDKSPKDAKDPLPVYPDRSAGQSQTMHEENGTFGTTKHTIHRELGPGRLERVTVAVLVNDRMSPGKDAAAPAIWRPRSSEEMHRLEGLTQAAVGFDARRGDQVTVENVSFSGNGIEEPTGPVKLLDKARSALHEEPAALRLALLAALGLLVVMMVLRPVAKQMVATLKAPTALPAGAGRTPALGSSTAASAPALGQGRAELEPVEAISQVRMEQVAEQIRKSPAQSKRLLENWITGPQEGS